MAVLYELLTGRGAAQPAAVSERWDGEANRVEAGAETAEAMRSRA
jgi:hypothetical protein